MGRVKKGAIAPPIEEPLSKKAVANARSRFGNHSETTLVAAGQLPDSAAPSKNRNAAKLRSPVAREVIVEMIEYQATVRLRPRRVPKRSNILPQRPCPTEYAIRKAITRLA